MKELVELLVDAGDLESEALGLSHQAIDLLQSLSQRLHLGEIDRGQVLRLVEQASCLILQRLDLVVDLGERPGGRQDVLAVVARVEHCQLRVGRRTCHGQAHGERAHRSEEHTSELQSLMRISYAVFCLKKKKIDTNI